MSGAKKGKFMIKPFWPNAQMDEKQADKNWALLESAITEIHRHNASSLSFEELYRTAYNLVLHKHGEKLYTGVHSILLRHLQMMSQGVAQTSDATLLEQLQLTWEDHQVTMVMIRDILMYMDRTFVVHNKRTPVYDMGLKIFRESIARHAQVKDRLRNILLANIASERNGEVIDRSLLHKTLKMLVTLGVKSRHMYEQDFERPFLEATAQFYQHESQEYLAQNTCPDYLRKAEERLGEEALRVTHYLDASTEPKLKDIVETELIKRHAQKLVNMENSGLVAMLRDDKVEDLSRMATLFNRVPSTLEDVRAVMKTYITQCGMDLVREQEERRDPVQFVAKLLEMRDKYELIVTQAFRASKLFQKTLKESFETFMNHDASTAKYLAQHVNEMLGGGFKGLGEDEVEDRLEKVVVLFRYLEDKDVYENYHKTYLAKRLLSGRSVSDEAERNMIGKFKQECGYQYTSKLEGMFTDMKMSKDIMEDFRKSAQWRAYLSGGGGGGGGAGRAGGAAAAAAAAAAAGGDESGQGRIELATDVLTTGYWPMSTQTHTVPLPPEVTPATDSFKDFYMKSHNGRKLQWQMNMGTADIKATFAGGKRKELNVSTYQMLILLLFNAPGRDVITFGEIKERTQIPEKELKRHIISISAPSKVSTVVKSNRTEPKPKPSRVLHSEVQSVGSSPLMIH